MAEQGPVIPWLEILINKNLGNNKVIRNATPNTNWRTFKNR
jgi:hypothetical protein